MSLLCAQVGDRIAQGTATSANSSLIDATAGSGLSLFDTDNDPAITDKWLTIYDGTQAGDSVRLNSYTAATFTAVPLPAFTGNLGTDSEYFIHERFSFREFLQALQRAQRLLNFDPRLGRGLMKETGPHREIMLGNALTNPVFDLYTTPNAPDGWVDANSTLTQETTITYGGARRALKVVTDGANVANLTQSLAEVGRYKGRTLSCYAWVYATVASEVFLRITDGGTALDSSLHGGAGWEKLLVNYPVTDDISELTASVRTTTTQAVTFRVQVVWVPKSPSDDHIYDIDSDINFVVIDGDMRISAGGFSDSGGNAGDFDIALPPGAWNLVRGSTRSIRLSIDAGLNGRILEYTGYSNHAPLVAVGTVWGGEIEAIIPMAAAILDSTRGAPIQQPSISRAISPTIFGDIASVQEEIVSRWGFPMRAGWRQAENIQ